MTGRIELPGAATRAGHGPVRHRGPGPAPSGWLDPRGRTLGGRAFALNRLTGLGLVVYLYLHLGVLSLLLGGASTWGSLLRIVTSVAFLGMDVVLLFVLLFHGLNGVRVALIGSGLAVEHQRMLFWTATAVGTIVLTAAAIDLLGSA